MKLLGFVRSDEGYATILAAGIIAALAGLAFVVAALGAAQIEAHRAQVSADLAAVAGAFAHAYGEDGCAQARWVAELNDAPLVACQEEVDDLVVTSRYGRAEATALAGPL